MNSHIVPFVNCEPHTGCDNTQLIIFYFILVQQKI